VLAQTTSFIAVVQLAKLDIPIVTAFTDRAIEAGSNHLSTIFDFTTTPKPKSSKRQDKSNHGTPLMKHCWVDYEGDMAFLWDVLPLMILASCAKRLGVHTVDELWASVRSIAEFQKGVCQAIESCLTTSGKA
jgi:hypothetical protein